MQCSLSSPCHYFLRLGRICILIVLVPIFWPCVTHTFSLIFEGGSIANVFREHIGNIKYPYYPPQKKEIFWASWVHATSPHWLPSKVSILTFVCHHFRPMLMARPYIWGTSPFPKIEALWPPFTIYIHESSTLNKAYGRKMWCYSEPLGNLMGTP